MPVAPMGFHPSGVFPRCQVPGLVTQGLPSWCCSSVGRKMLNNISSAEARRCRVVDAADAFCHLQGLAPSSESVLPIRCYPGSDSRSPLGLPKRLSRVSTAALGHGARTVYRSCASSRLPSGRHGTEAPRASSSQPGRASADFPTSTAAWLLSQRTPLVRFRGLPHPCQFEGLSVPCNAGQPMHCSPGRTYPHSLKHLGAYASSTGV
jgi:hypothetical protein